MLTVLTWRWGSKYGPEYVDRLRKGVTKHLSMPHRFLCVGEDIPIEDPHLLEVRDGCYARLRMFDPHWQVRNGIDRLICLDLDMVVTGPLHPLFDRPDPFMILHGGHFNPCPFNGSVMMINRGARPEVWNDFSIEKAERVATRGGEWRGSDQTWIADVAPDASGWSWRDGIFAWQKPGWPKGEGLPSTARLVAFPGKVDPSQLRKVPWVKEHWHDL